LSVLPSQSVTFDVKMDASTLGMNSATIVINSNDVDEAIFTFDVEGEVIINPEITVAGVLTGGTVAMGSTSLNTDLIRTITITNDGTTDLDISSITISSSSVMSILSPLVTPLSVLPSQSVTFDVKMDASTLGMNSATIVINSNDADENPFTFDVEGSVINNNPPPPPPTDYTIQAPTDLTGVSVSTNQINLTWEDNSDNEDGFYVYQNGILIATLPAGSNDFEVLGLNANTFYNFKITAFNVEANVSTNTLNIATLPNAPVIGQNIAVCGAGGTAFVQLNGAPDQGSYRWYTDAVGGSPLAEVTNGFFETPVLTQTTTFYATAVSSNGVESSPRLAVEVFVYEAVNAELVEGNTVLSCDAETTLHAVEQVGAMYQWKLNGILTSQVGKEFNATTSGNYQLIVNRDGCSDIYNFSVMLDYQPDAIIANGTTVDFCESGILSASNLNTDASYEWLQNGSVIASGTSVNVSQSGDYTLRVTENSCVSEDQISVNIFDLPQNQVVTTSATEFCEGDVVELSVPLMNGVTYTWFRNGIQISGAKSEQYTAYQEGEYSVEMSVPNLGCESMSENLAISWFVSPEVVLTKDDKTLSLAIPIPHESVTWFMVGGESLPQFANQTSISPDFGTYWATVTYPTTCVVTTNSIRLYEEVKTPTGLDDGEDEGSTFEVFPNPSQSGIFQVRLRGTFDKDAQLKLSDALGRDLNISIAIQQNVETLTIDLSQFASGMYHLQFISSEGTLTKKIIKK
jgi:hypothetical protein